MFYRLNPLCTYVFTLFTPSMQKIQKQLRDSFQDDIAELSKPLQDLLKNGFDT